MNPRERRRRRALSRLFATTGCTLSEHALLRAHELGYSLDEVLHCVHRPEQSYPGGHGHPPGRRILQRRDLAIVLDLMSRSVITVLPRTQEEWRHGVHNRRALG